MAIIRDRSLLARQLGMTGLYVLAASAWAVPAGVDLGLILMLAGTALEPKLYRTIWSQGWVWILLVFAVSIVASAVWGLVEFPGSFGPQTTAVYRWSKLLVFFLPAWWLCQDDRAISRVFFLSLSGFLLMVAVNAKWADVLTFRIDQSRPGFGLSDPNVTAMPSALYLLSLALFAPRLVGTFRQPRVFWSRLVFGGAAFWVLSYVLLASLSRQAWVAMAIVAPPLVAFRYFAFLKQNASASDRWRFALLLIPLVAVAILAAGNRGALTHRMVEEKIDIGELASQQKEVPGTTTVPVRINMIKFGFDKWLERPVFGWGIGSTKEVMKSSQDRRVEIPNREPNATAYFLNLHNTYVEILVRMGAVGAAAWMGLFLAVMRILVREYRLGAIPLDTFLFLLGMGLMMLALGWFSFYVGNNRGCVYWLLLAGSIYSLRLRRDSVIGSPHGAVKA